MKRFFLVLAAMLSLGATSVHAQAPHIYTQPELDALVAPIALYPDGLVTQILGAAKFPDQVAAASQLPREAQPDESWDPNVKALLAFPEVLTRMGESPQWTRDLGLAFANQEPHVMDTVQSLRRRAQQNGQLQTNDQQSVTQQDQAIVVQPRNPEVVYVPYYDPYVVYGGWWWPAYRPVIWSPWIARPCFVGVGFFWARPNWATRQVVVVNKTVNVQRNVIVRPNIAVQRNVVVRDWHRASDSQHQSQQFRGGTQSRSDGGRQSQSRPDGRQSQQPQQPRSDGRQPQQRSENRSAMPAPSRFSDSRSRQQPNFAANDARRATPQGNRGGEVRSAPRGGEMRSTASRGGETRSTAPRSGEMRGGGWGGGHGGGNGGGGHGGSSAQGGGGRRG